MSENAMTRPCPICGSEAVEIDQGTFDGTAFRCKTHGEVEVDDHALPVVDCPGGGSIW